MSLTRPILLSVTSFDATQDKMFRFEVGEGGSQIVANKLVIRTQLDNQIVYSAKQESFRYEHTVPANTLENGQYYNAVISVFDARGNESPASSPTQFRCYTTPTIEITNFPATKIINNSSYNFEFTYTQPQGERLNSYVVKLYDISQKLISSSDVIFVREGSSPYNGNYLFTGFTDDTAYYIEIIGTTVNGAMATTGKLLFNVDYEQPDLFTLLELENNCEGGYITASSNIILIDGVANPDPPKFIDNKEIDLTSGGSYVEWPEGYVINGDILVRAWFRKPNDYSSIISFNSANGQRIRMFFMKGYESAEDAEMKAYVGVAISSIAGMEYYIHSNYMTPLADDKYYVLQFQRINDLFQVELQAKEAL